MMKWSLRNGRNCQGMSLVELLVVMAILSVVMLAVMSLYIPAHQSTVAQTQVTDVQDNLRLALKVMTRDLLHGGFLASDAPLTENGPSDFTINTRIVGRGFARISSAENLTGEIGIKLEDDTGDMISNFAKDDLVRLFEPVSGSEVSEFPLAVTVSDRVYRVEKIHTGTDTIDIDIATNPTLDKDRIVAETVMVKVRNTSDLPLQTIQYKLDNESLERIVNGVRQVLARNIDTSSGLSKFEYVTALGSGRVIQVDIKLAGKTKAFKNDAISGEKIRSVETSVKLRNVF